MAGSCGGVQEEAAFKHYLSKVEAERDQDVFICQLHYGSQGKVACQVGSSCGCPV